MSIYFTTLDIELDSKHIQPNFLQKETIASPELQHDLHRGGRIRQDL
jgi:hypothetical protein